MASEMLGETYVKPYTFYATCSRKLKSYIQEFKSGIVLDNDVCSLYPFEALTPTIGPTVVFNVQRILVMKEKGKEWRKIYT
jgi:hypothetical protein